MGLCICQVGLCVLNKRLISFRQTESRIINSSAEELRALRPCRWMSHIQIFNKGSVIVSRWDVEICQHFRGVPHSGSERSVK